MPRITDYRNNVDGSKTFNFVGYVSTTEETYTLPFVTNKVTIKNSGSDTIQITSVSPVVNILAFESYTLKNINSLKLKALTSSSSVQIIGFKQVVSMTEIGQNLSVPTWDTVASPIILAHRGGANVFPENTLAAFDYALAIGADALECDLQKTVDGVYIVLHDQTLDATTDLTGDVTQMRHDIVMSADASSKFKGGILPEEKIPTLNEFLDKYSGKILLCPELKDSTVNDGAIIAQTIVNKNLIPYVLVQSFNQSALQLVKDTDPRIKTLLLGGDPGPSVSILQSLGCWAVGVPSVAATQAYIDSCHAVGIKVVVYTIDSVKTAETLISRGVDGIITDDPVYLKSKINTDITLPHTITMPKKYIGSGFSIGNVNIATVVNNKIGWTTPTAGVGAVGLGVRMPTGKNYKLSCTVTVDSANADTSRHFGFFVCSDRDDPLGNWGNPSSQNAYSIGYRATGTVEITKMYTNQNYVTSSTGTFPTYTTGHNIPLEILVTATDITIKRTDGAVPTFTLTNNEFSRNGWIGLYTASQGVSVGNITITEI